MGGGGARARVSEFGVRGGGMWGVGVARESEFYLQRGGGGGKGNRGVDGWTDKQAQSNLPNQLLRSWGLNNA